MIFFAFKDNVKLLSAKYEQSGPVVLYSFFCIQLGVIRYAWNLPMAGFEPGSSGVGRDTQL